MDLDGTVMKHNGWEDSNEALLPGVKEFWDSIPADDYIIITSARALKYQDSTLKFLDSQGLRYNHYIFDLPIGERILINDIKPSGLDTAIGINVERNLGLSNITINIDPTK